MTNTTTYLDRPHMVRYNTKPSRIDWGMQLDEAVTTMTIVATIVIGSIIGIGSL
jgi:hypothetical protein